MNKGCKWRVQSAPKGPFRSFESRGWPQLFASDETLLATILGPSDYSAEEAKRDDLKLSVRIYDYSQGVQNRKIRVSKQTFCTMQEAKNLVARMFGRHPEWLPKVAK